MSSVTKRIGEIKQPRGGYLKPSQMKVVQLSDSCTLSNSENVHWTIIGLVVDYLTRFMLTKSYEDAFRISLKGAYNAQLLTGKDTLKEAISYMEQIQGLDDNSIVNACKLVTYDVWLRAPLSSLYSKGPHETNPDCDTVNNIRIMVQRSIAFWQINGPVVENGFTFEPNGYTEIITSGDGDYLTEDTLWDVKVSKKSITSQNTMQILMYWIMGKHSGNSIFENIDKIGIFNPRQNVMHTFDMRYMPQDVIREIEKNVIGYK